MRVYIDNIGIIRDSYIDIDGITVITGHNNSGKTTVGKAVNALYSAVDDLETEADIDKSRYIYSSVQDVIYGVFIYYNSTNELNLGNKISVRFNNWRNKWRFVRLSNAEEYCDEAINILESILDSPSDQIYGMFKDGVREQMGQRISVLKASGDIKKAIDTMRGYKRLICDDPDAMKYADRKIIKSLQSEFHDQITPLKYRDRTGKIRIIEKDINVFDVIVSKNESVNKAHLYNPMSNSEVEHVLMIDDAGILDDLANNQFLPHAIRHWPNQSEAIDYYRFIVSDDHKVKLAEKMLPSASLYREIKNEEYARHVLDIIDGAFDEEIELSGTKLICSESKLDVRNLAAGSKMFAIIRQLLLKGQFTDRTLLILDEPDDHLHPEWQMMLAKTLYILCKEVGVKILLTTHSTNMVYAFEILKMSNEVGNMLRVYDTNRLEDTYSVTYKDVTNNLNVVYRKLGEPFVKLRREEKKYADR